MSNKRKKIIGSFGVKSRESSHEIVVISQEADPGSLGIKRFNLNSADGEEVFRTQDPNTFVLGNGARLKKIGFVELC